MKRRLIKHHLPLLIIVLIVMVFFYFFRGKRDFIASVTQSTGYISLVILAMSLIIGTVNLILKNRNPVSTYFRRDIGITAGIIALVHSVTGLFVHLRGKMWLYFLNDNHQIRLDNFGLGNYTGLFAALIIILLVITSNDYFIKKLTPLRWKKIQRLSYLMILLIAAHCYYYTIGRDNLSIFYWFYIPLFSIVLGFQLIGIYLTFSSPSKGHKISFRNFKDGY